MPLVLVKISASLALAWIVIDSAVEMDEELQDIESQNIVRRRRFTKR